MENQGKILIIGAGPAGLAAAREILDKDPSREVIVLEKEEQVGGICRTFSHKGFRFDAGGHRFFTKNEEVEKLWRDTIGEDFLKRNRLSRIFYNGKFYSYPLKISNVLGNLGLAESFLILVSYAKQKIKPYPREDNLEQWISNRFGKRLFDHFFKTYTEKLWGIPASEIGSDWGAQRIKGLSLVTAVKNALFPKRGDRSVKTLIDSFDYPKYGVGQMYDLMAEKVEKLGGRIIRGAEVVKLSVENGRIAEVEIATAKGRETLAADQVISSMPLTELVERIETAGDSVKQAARAMKYRSFLTACVILEGENYFPDNWIYVHSKVKMGRIQNFKNWSEYLVPEAGKIALGLEYFCDEGDGFWTMKDEDLLKLGMEELEAIGLGKKEKYIDGFVARSPKAYPTYDANYTKNLPLLMEFVAQFKNLQPIGRAGLFRYNNMDHSILTGLYAARNILNGDRALDVWSVNADEEYHEVKK